jgi:probable LLM family oxidoreductase
MELGIDSFAAFPINEKVTGNIVLQQLLERITLADQVGLHSFGIGEHHRADFLDSAPTMILAAAAAQTKNIRLTSAVTVLSAADPVRVFQNFATLDLLSNGRAEIVAGRGSFTDAFPLFGLDLDDYDDVFTEKLNLLLQIRDNEKVTWDGRYRPSLTEQEIFPRPLQPKLPIWLGVGGTPASFARAGTLGLPLMVAVIGGETHRFAPLVKMYRQAGETAGYKPYELKVGLHSLGYVAEGTQEALDTYYPGYKTVFDKVGLERGWPPVTREGFNTQSGYTGALLVGESTAIAERILRHSEALGGISRITLNMDIGLPHNKMMQAIELLGTKVAPLLKNL